ncbi:MAG TPA: hydrogen peroxide-inducible genes activator [Ignavibacteriales bacterium]|nr:hydrogen peroxide-inducible genes activator [Ignavibacteriales bacterium]
MVSLIQLSYIVAVDNYRHFATAARHCFVTQPTLSMQIQKLEEELGVLIFDRSKQPVAPTDIGRSIIEQARRTLQEAARIQDIIEVESNEISGTLRLGVIPTVAPYLLPLFLDSFLKNYPKVDMIIDEIQTDQILEKLRKEEIDLGLMATPLYQNDLIEKPLFYEPFVAYISRDHRLFHKKKISPEDLSAQDMLLLKEGHCFRGHTLQLCKDEKTREGKDLSPNLLRIEGGNLDTLKKLVEKNFGMTLLPYLAARDIDRAKKEMYVREFHSPVPKREISLVYLRAYLKKHIISALEEEILKSVPKDMLKKEKSLIVS